jgi:hypothetical protein
MASTTPGPDVFDDAHYASTILRKAQRSFQLGPKYYLLDVPRYWWHRRTLKLPIWDAGALVNPFREFRQRCYRSFAMPPGYTESLKQLAEAGVRLTMPRVRLEALLGAWWESRAAIGNAIECGSYRGATALLIAVLAKVNRIEQVVHMLDTFQGIPETSRFDVSRHRGEFVALEDQVDVIWQQAEQLGVHDRIEVHQGLFSESFARWEGGNPRFAFGHIDANIYQGTIEACEFVIPRTSQGGLVVFDDYNGVCDLGARLAIDRYLAGQSLKPTPLAGSSAVVEIPRLQANAGQ